MLANAAFGTDPGCWPLPEARTPRDHWLRAVAAGGQGRYGSAFADLAMACRIERTGPLASLAHSTHASFLRQLGWHDRARGWDGRAYALAGSDPQAGADALIGLAADALGVRRFPAAAFALRRAGELLAKAPPRLPVRLAWVRAELAMARGDGAAAVHDAEQAVELAAGLGSARHAVKSQVVLAAALCSVGEIDRCRAVADAALATTGRLGTVPLRWALACLLADIGSAEYSAVQVIGIRNESADAVRRWGGEWPDR